MQEANAVLVVGGAGYIGSHAAKMLRQRGYTPIVLDDLSTGHEKAVKYGSFYKGSYADDALVKEILDRHKIGTVMHFGAKALVEESVADPLLYYKSNVGHTLSLLSAARQAGAKNFIFSSTCATFGKPAESSIHEGVGQRPVNPYGHSKLMVEHVLKELQARHHDFRYGILRYFNAAGADPEGEIGEDHFPETHLIPRALQVALGREKKLVVFGNDYPTPDGSCIRDYVHVNDLAEAHLKAMELMNAENSSFEFNLGSGKGYSVFEIVKAIKKVTGVTIDFEVGDRRPGDPPLLVADGAKALKTLGWRPRFSLDDIIATAFGWMQENPQGYGDRV